jgi:hypothetical protein
MANLKKTTGDCQPACYQITISGKLSENWSDWLSGMEISTENEDGENQITTLTGSVTDQPALRGILCKIWDLNLTILTLTRVRESSETKGRN